MKYLQDYIQDKQTKLFEETNTIFAFSQERFEKQRKEGIQYVGLGHGMICDKRYVKKLMDGLDDILIEGMKQDVEENGIENIIRRELYNHEAFYSRCIDSTYDAVKKYSEVLGYDLTEDMIWKIFNNRKARF